MYFNYIQIKVKSNLDNKINKIYIYLGEKMELKNEFLISIYKNIYIIITSMVISFVSTLIFKYRTIHLSMVIRIYYIICSLILFIMLNQIKKYNEKYIYKIVYKFFCLIIFISFFGFIINKINRNMEVYIYYITISGKLISLIEATVAYLLSEHILERKQDRLILYLILEIMVITILCISKELYAVTSLIYIATILFVVSKVILNLRELASIYKKREYSILMLYVTFALLTEMYSLFNDSSRVCMRIEWIHFVNYRMVWNILCVNLVKKPFVQLSNSLNLKNKELDKLNLEISMKNVELETSIATLKSKENLEYMLFKFMPHPVLMVNADNNRIIFANKKFLDFLEIDNIKEIINNKADNYISCKSCDTNKEIDGFNSININNETKYFQAIILDNYSNSNAHLIVINDITSKIQTVKIKKELEKKRNEEHMKAQFISSVSHDLKTPINVIYSASQVEEIYIKIRDANNLRKYNQISKRNCFSLIQLTNNLIDNSQIKSNYLVPNLIKVNLVEVVEDNVMALVDYIKLNQIDLIFDTNVEECYLNIDIEYMQRIILNLISNSVKYTPINGKIFVTITVSSDYAEICIKDTGKGMSDDFIKTAFERYSVAGNEKMDLKSGSGIGLSVVKELVELQNGTIDLKNNIDCGLSCIMKFPYKESYII